MKSNGFTLIEILLVISIMFLASGGSYLTFTRFAKQQSLNTNYENLRNTFNEAKSKALSQVTTKCTMSETLVGHRIRFFTSTTPDSYAIEEVCANSSGVERNANIKTINLSSDITFTSNPSPILFLVLSSAGIRGNSDMSVTITNGSNTRTITVTTVGIIQ